MPILESLVATRRNAVTVSPRIMVPSTSDIFATSPVLSLFAFAAARWRAWLSLIAVRSMLPPLERLHARAVRRLDLRRSRGTILGAGIGE